MPVVDGLPRAVPLGQIPPRAAGPHPMQHPVDHPAVIGPPPPLPNIDRQQRHQPGPLLVGQLMTPQPLVILPTHSQTNNRTVIYRTRPNPAGQAWVTTLVGSARRSPTG